MSDQERDCGCQGDDCCQKCDPERIRQSLRERIIAAKAKAAAAEVGAGKYNKAKAAAQNHGRKGGGRGDQ